ncbi:chromate transport protein ChrA [Alkalibacillus filiformis]|uniref:Chromate transport protein ChrA n=1 Tax=Alkalibacillus filiformis TaxID=200990 RepID=A0ABU0DVK7_9BACI|nr:YqhV family protein [Alkalibacillus filiformis]MDQ0352489.1 chromate transport protein ChrA [Alkalibacillus filiformis]
MSLDKLLLAIIMIRVFSGTLEITAAYLMYRFNDLYKAFVINSLLAFVGPGVLLLTTFIGLYGLAGKISLLKAILLVAGILLIIISLRIK